jgi:hypothetical protein
MATEWVPALLGGVELAGGAGVLSPDDVRCVFYGDVFRRPGRLLGEDDLGWLSPEDVQDPAEAELLAHWWQAAAMVDSGVVPPGVRTLSVASGVQAALAALSGSRFLAGTTELLLVLWLKQVHAYFTRAEIREQVQQRFCEAVGEDTAVVVAHSLGSVVAYEALCAHPEWNIHTLVTVGSPLGIRNIIFDRLHPSPQTVEGTLRGVWPGPVRTWTNIADRMDFVALEKQLKSMFDDQITDIEITNGVRMHNVWRYLTARETGKAILAAFRMAGEGRNG